MNANELSRIQTHPAFHELARKRASFGWTLAVIMMAVYGAFIVLVAFDRSAMAQPIGDGPLTVAFPLGLGVIALAIILTGVYVVRANGEFDRLTAEIVGHAQTAPSLARGALMAGLL